MSSSAQFLNPSTAAQRLGVSIKALRLYEQRGLVAPSRTAAGWRVYGPEEIADCRDRSPPRTRTQPFPDSAGTWRGPQRFGASPGGAPSNTRRPNRQLVGAVEKVRDLRTGLTQGKPPTVTGLVRLLGPTAEFSVAFDLPWPWGGERFELRDVRPLNYIIGPLGSGKTRLAKRLAETLPNAAFLGLDRLEHGCGRRRPIERRPGAQVPGRSDLGLAC